MSMENLFIIQKQSCGSMPEFISHWRALYSYFDDNRYRQNIDKNEFTVLNLEELFHWKNGMKLSSGKEKSLQENILNHVVLINQYKKSSSIDLGKFNADFKDVSAVWRIFLLHTIKPTIYPIYDQHIHRTFNFIHNLNWQSVNNTIPKKIKLDFYYNTYLPYVQNLGVINLKAMDEAFFAFGQFLNTRNQKVLLEL